MFVQMQDDKMNADLLVAVFKVSAPEINKEKEEQYRKDIDECNKQSEYRHMFVLLHAFLPTLQRKYPQNKILNYNITDKV
jgi:hypothetical protein